MTDMLARSNRILGALPAPEFRSVYDDLKLANLPQGEVINEPMEPIERVYFPLDCVLSQITVMANGDAVESGVVGREGFSAPQLALGSYVPANAMICQVPGQAMVMRADLFRSHLEALPEFKNQILSYLELLFNFMGQSVACNRLHPLSERLARWLLATHDRIGKNEFLLTQEFLAIMLGVARTAVTATASNLQRAGLISYSRGLITILDRKALEAAACECYEIVAKGLEATMAAKIS